MKIGDRVRCVCGEEHEVSAMVFDMPLVVCPKAPPDAWWLMNTAYVYALDANNSPQGG